MSKKNKQAQTLSRRGFIAIGIGFGLAVATGTYFATRTKSIFDAKQLGDMPITYSSGKGKPIVYLAQIHPASQREILRSITPQIAGQDETNIDAIIKAAFEAYDEYGIHALFIEGFAHTYGYESTGKITLQPANQPTYRKGIERLLNERRWNWYPDSREAIDNLIATDQKAMAVYQKYQKKLYDSAQEELEKAQANPDRIEEANKRIRLLHSKYQMEVWTYVDQHKEELISAIYTDRELACMEIAKKALEKEDGITVVYGGYHADNFKEHAAKAGIPIVIARQKTSDAGMSMNDRIMQRFRLYLTLLNAPARK